MCGSIKDAALAHLKSLCRGGRIHTQWGCREVLFAETSAGAEATGLRMTKAGKEQIVEADVYVAALDVPGLLLLLFMCALRCFVGKLKDCTAAGL